MKQTLRILSKFLVVTGLLFAVATAGFAHHATPKTADQEIANFLASINAADAFCDDLEGTTHGTADSCEACRLFSNAALNAAPDHFAPAQWGAVSLLGFAAPSRLTPTLLDPSRPVRAPPVI